MKKEKEVKEKGEPREEIECHEDDGFYGHKKVGKGIEIHGGVPK